MVDTANTQGQQTYKVMLVGARPEISVAEARLKLAVLFKTTPDQVDQLLAMPSYVLKTGLTKEIAGKYKAAVEASGGGCVIQTEEQGTVTLEIDLPADNRSMLPPDQEQPEKKPAHQSAPEGLSALGEYFTVTNLIMWVFFGATAWYSLQFLFPNFSAPKEFLLDKVTVIGSSTRSDYDKFVDEGGLAKNPVWHGIHVTELHVVFKSNVVSIVQIRTDGKAKWFSSSKEWSSGSGITPKEVRQLLSPLCGIAETNWQVSDMGGIGESRKGGSKLSCNYTIERNGYLTITVGSD